MTRRVSKGPLPRHSARQRTVLSAFVAQALISWAAAEGVAAPRHPRIHPAVYADFERLGADRLKVWVIFSDKGLKTQGELRAAIEKAKVDLHPRARQRRSLRRVRPDLADFDDVPVSAQYVARVRASGAELHVVSDVVNAVSVTGTLAQIEQIAELPFVRQIQPVLRSMGGKNQIEAGNVTAARVGRERAVERTGGVERLEGVPSAPAQSTGDATSGGPVGEPAFYGLSFEQVAQIRLDEVHRAGWTGAGVMVGVLDTGFDRRHSAFNFESHRLKVVAERDFLRNDFFTGPEANDPPTQHFHGTWVLGVIAGFKPGELIGAAFDAAYILCKTEDTTAEYPAEEDLYVQGLQFIEKLGGDVVTSSLGYIDWYTKADLDGMTAVTTLAINMATANGLHCVTAAGNQGHDADPQVGHLIAPGDAFRVITVGSVDSSGRIASFSSDGPTFDLRVKPELLARGVQTWTVSPIALSDYQQASGTSLATPLIAGLVACLVQAHPEWTVDQMRWYLLHTAGDFAKTLLPDPLFIRGYGIADGAAAVIADCNGNGVPDASDLAAGTSADCNHSKVPDECELALNPKLDKNGNGQIDECEKPAGIPATSTWGLVVLGLALGIVGTVVVGRPVRSLLDLDLTPIAPASSRPAARGF